MKNILSSFVRIMIVYVAVLFSFHGAFSQFTVTNNLTNQISPGPLTVNNMYIGMANHWQGTAIGVGASASFPIGLTNGGNVAIGLNALNLNTAGFANTAIGTYSMERLNAAAASNNTSVGYKAMQGGTLVAITGGGNTAVGQGAMGLLQSGSNNAAFGYSSLTALTTGSFNSAYGYRSLTGVTSGSYNAAFGYNALAGNNPGDSNVSVGAHALAQLNSDGRNNIAVGYKSLFKFQNGTGNIALGYSALAGEAIGVALLSGSNNVGIGFMARLPVLSGGNANNQLSIQNVIHGINMTSAVDGRVSVGLANGPTPIVAGGILSVGSYAKFQVGGELRINSVPNFTTTNSTKFLFVDNNGVVVQGPPTGFVTSTCANENYVPVFNAGGGIVRCSQIYDNGVSVGIGPLYNGVSANFSYSATSSSAWHNGAAGFTLPTNGQVRLAVDGVAQAHAFFSTSDGKLKKDIETLKNPIDDIKKLRGVSYRWNDMAVKEMGFTEIPQVGFIAQEVEKIIPEAIIKKSNGYLAVNYSTIVPILTEAVKEQQKHIENQKLRIENLSDKIDELTEKINHLIPGNTLIKENYFQVSPNPLTNASLISYSIPDVSSRSFFMLYDLQGKQIKRYNLPIGVKSGNVEINKSGLSNGMYILALIVNNAELQTTKVLVSE